MNNNSVAVAQGDFNLFGGMSKNQKVTVPSNYISKCTSARDAAILCMKFDPIAGRNDAFYADVLRIDRAAFSRMMNGKSRWGINEFELERVCSNDAITLWRNYMKGWAPVPRQETTAERIERLEAELARRVAE